jgi:hypothetical protein
MRGEAMYGGCMVEFYLQLRARFVGGLHVSVTVAGIVLVHIAAWLLYTASAPYMGSGLAILGMGMYAVGSRRPWLKPRHTGEINRSTFRA